MKDYRLYILMRNDLDSMSHGRACAQASHAANVFAHDFGPGSKCYRKEYKDWAKQTPQGFGTAIVLSASMMNIDDIFKRGPFKRWIMKGLVVDPDYGVKTTWELFDLIPKRAYTRWHSSDTNTTRSVTFFRKVVTCAYIFGEREELIPAVGHLELY